AIYFSEVYFGEFPSRIREHMISKLDHIFDRDFEWNELVRFASDQRPLATLGIVTGRRRYAQELLGGKGYDARDAVLICASGKGFDEELLATKQKQNVLFIRPEDLYA
ncbi:MAG: hypothetical protein ACREN8_09105, partial [Candidatus Dormibacteraceae bacterium]